MVDVYARSESYGGHGRLRNAQYRKREPVEMHIRDDDLGWRELFVHLHAGLRDAYRQYGKVLTSDYGTMVRPDDGYFFADQRIAFR